MATHSSIPVWSIPRTEEPGGRQSMWSQRVKHTEVTATVLYFGFFGPEACEILAPQPGVETSLPALEGEVLTPGPPGSP